MPKMGVSNMFYNLLHVRHLGFIVLVKMFTFSGHLRNCDGAIVVILNINFQVKISSGFNKNIAAFKYV